MSEQNNNPKLEIWQPLLLSIMVVVGMLIGYRMNDKPENFVTELPIHEKIEIGQVEEIIRLIETRYTDHIDRDQLIESAINGMLTNLDPHSMYVSKEYLSDLTENMNGSFKGIGIESYHYKDTAFIVKIIKNSPADKAGLKPFDRIIKVNNVATAGTHMPFDSIKNLIKHSKEYVMMEVKRAGEKETLIKNIKVDDIAIHVAEIAYPLNDSVGYIEIKQFSNSSYKEFMEGVEKLIEKQKCKHLIIDLRGNPGGFLPEATKIVNQLFKEGKNLIVYTEDRNKKRQDYYTNGKTFFDINKIAILVDENSASGSEVIAGAIQDQDRGIIIGRQTYGKGLVQEQFDLSNGAAVRLTTARYFCPSGRNIQKPYENDTTTAKPIKQFETLHLKRKVYSSTGIQPDVEIKNTETYIDYNTRFLINEFVITQFINGKLRLNESPNLPILTHDFLNYSKDSKKPINLDEGTLSKLLAEEVNYFQDQDSAKTQSIAKSKIDQFIDSAMKYFKGDIRLK